MQCPRCQHENPAGQKFCGECGARLAAVCASCGASNSPGQKFCGECGAALGQGAVAGKFSSARTYTPKHLAEKILTSKSALEGERKQVTVLFADLKGSMELLADRDPEEARKILDPVLELMMEAVHRYEGTVNQVMGDGIMALFGAPVAHEDHAVRACYAALRMQESVRGYAESIRRTEGIPIQIRVGLNSGEVVVRSIGSDLHMDYTAVGQTTHLAARMEQMAAPGSILVAQATLDMAEGYVVVKPLGSMPVKGLELPIEVHEVTAATAVRSRLHAAAGKGLTRFVGRESELEQLRQALEAARAGRGQVVAVIGEPGVGKSRLYWEFTHSHRIQGWLIVESGSVSYGKATAFLPILGLLRAYFQVEARDEARKIREKVTGKMLSLDRALEPSLPALLWLLDVPVEDPQWQRLDPPQRRQQTLDGIKRLLLRESQVQPLLVLFEDLHWIDGETQALLDSLVESLPTARLLLLVNYRPEYQHTWGGKSYYHQLRIDPLSPESADELLEALLGLDAELAPLKRLLVKRTEGNPFFLEESVRTLVETKALVGERGAYHLATAAQPLQIPATAQAILAARIDRLSPENKRLLQAASVIGKDVPFALLRAIAECSEETLRSALSHLQAAEFLYEAQLFPDLEYTFKHALIHEVTYGSLLHERRRALHAQIVDAIERLAPNRISEHTSLLAHHALRGERWEQALTYSRHAAARAQAQSAFQGAVGYLENALASLTHLPPEPAMVEQAIDVRLELRNALFALGDHGRIIRYLGEAAELARTVADQRRAGRASAIVSLSLWATGQHAAAADSARQAETIATVTGDGGLTVLANFYLGVAHYAVGDYRRSASHLRRNIAALTGQREGERFGLMGPPAIFSRTFLGWSLSELGEFEEAGLHGLKALELADGLGEPYVQVHARVGMGLTHLRRGDVVRVLPLLERAMELCERWGQPLWLPTVTTQLAQAYIRSGRAADALSLLNRALREASAMGMRANRPLTLTCFSEALLSLGRVAEARDCADEGLNLARQLGERGHEAWALWVLGQVEGLESKPAGSAGRSPYHEALILARELEMRPLAAHCHLGLGKLYWRMGQREQAQEYLTTATTMYREMGMTYWLEQAEAEMGGMA